MPRLALHEARIVFQPGLQHGRGGHPQLVDVDEVFAAVLGPMAEAEEVPEATAVVLVDMGHADDVDRLSAQGL